MLERVKNFTSLVGLSALLVAGSAAFFSVFGLSKLFSGAQLSVIIMAGSLEFTKLVAASFLYQYWYTVSKVLRIYSVIYQTHIKVLHYHLKKKQQLYFIKRID